MALKLNATMKNYLIDKGMIDQLAGTSGTAGTASLNIYNGTQPANADAGTNGTLLCTISNIGWNYGTSGSAALTGTVTGTAGTDGTATWARMSTVNSNGTFCLDGDVGTAGTAIFVINSAALLTDDIVRLLSANIVIP
jgi:hypothetical protein